MALYFGTQRISDVTIPMVMTEPQSITAGDTPVITNFDMFRSTSKDSYEEIANSAIVIPKSGIYRIKFSCIELNKSVFNTVSNAQIWVNHTERADGLTFSIPQRSKTTTFIYSEDIALSIGDVVTLALKSSDPSDGIASLGISACINWNNGF